MGAETMLKSRELKKAFHCIGLLLAPFFGLVFATWHWSVMSMVWEKRGEMSTQPLWCYAEVVIAGALAACYGYALLMAAGYLVRTYACEEARNLGPWFRETWLEAVNFILVFSVSLVFLWLSSGQLP